MQYTLSINLRACKAILAKTKRVEIRVNTCEEKFNYGCLKPGDTLLLCPPTGKQALCRITKVNWYPTAQALLTAEGTTYTLSSTNDFAAGVKSIHSFKGYTQGIIQNGVYAIHLTVL